MSDSSKAVFLSYASQDAEAARRICEALRGAGVEVWFDAEGGLEHGDEWDAKIRRQIKECVLFIAVISQNTQAREEGYFRIEWELAAERAMGIASGVAFILPMVIDDTREPDALVPDRFRKVQWTRVPGGAIAPEVRARLLKLWSHRAGAIAHTAAGSGEMETGRSRPAVRAENVTARARARSPLVLGSVGAGLIALAALGWWWSRPAVNPAAGAAPAAKSPAALAGGKLSEAQQLTARALATKALALIRQVDATREDAALAEDYCQQAMKLDATDAEVWAVYSGVLGTFIYRGWDATPERREQSRVMAERAIRLAPRSVEARLAQAGAWTTFGVNREGVEKLLREVLAEQPANQHVLRFLASVVLSQGRLDEALALMDRSAALPGGDALALYNKARALWARNRAEEAAAALEASLAQGPIASALTMKALINLNWRGDLDVAAAAIRQLPGSALLEDRANFYVGLLHYYQRNPAQALAAWGAFPREFYDDFQFSGPKSQLLGDAHELAKRPEAAKAEWRVALQAVEKRLALKPTDRTLLLFKAELLASLGEKAAAETALRTAQELGGNQFTARTPMSWWQARIYVRLGRVDEFLEQLPLSLANPVASAIRPAALRLDPRFDALRGDPRFLKLIELPARNPAP